MKNAHRARRAHRPEKSAFSQSRSRMGRNSAPKNIDEYLARVPEPARGTLNKIRAAIRSVAPPGATEAISYGMPAFKHNGVLVWFAAFSKHCSLFPGSSVIEAFRANLRATPRPKGRSNSPRTGHCQLRSSKKLVRARIAENERRK